MKHKPISYTVKLLHNVSSDESKKANDHVATKLKTSDATLRLPAACLRLGLNFTLTYFASIPVSLLSLHSISNLQFYLPSMLYTCTQQRLRLIVGLYNRVPAWGTSS